MRKIGFMYLSLLLLPLTSAAMQNNSGKTATQLVNETLAAHPEVYNFDHAHERFHGEAKALARVAELKRRKRAIIDAELLFKIDKNMASLHAENTVTVLGYSMRRSTIATCIKDVCSPLLAMVLSNLAWGDSDKLDPDIKAVSESDMAKLVAYQQHKEVRERALAVGFGVAHAVVDTQLMPTSFERELRECSCAKEDILFALDHDPFVADEEKMLKKWHAFPVGMQKNLIDNLITRRISSGRDKNMRALKEQFEYCLSLPTHYKELIVSMPGDDDDFNEKREAFIEEQLIKKPWSTYPAATKTRLKQVFSQLCVEAHRGVLGESTKRMILIFHGKPCTGKSTAAQEMAKMFDLPHMKLVFSDSGDLSERNLTGNSSLLSEQKLGPIFQALFATDKQGVNWKNSVVIIEEFDRLFKKDGILPFTLHMLDPSTRELKCDYFGKDVCIPLPSVLILTANSDLGKNEPMWGGKASQKSLEEFEALRDRLWFVHFEEFSVEAKALGIKDYIVTNKSLRYSVPFARADHEAVIKDIQSFIVNNFKDASLRQIPGLIDRLVDLPQDRWHTLKL